GGREVHVGVEVLDDQPLGDVLSLVWDQSMADDRDQIGRKVDLPLSVFFEQEAPWTGPDAGPLVPVLELALVEAGIDRLRQDVIAIHAAPRDHDRAIR